MPSYLCPRCCFSTSQRANFKRHLIRKNICMPVNTDTPIKRIAGSYGIDISTTETVGVIQKVIRITESIESNGLSNADNKKEHKCRFCNQSFKHKSNKSRHEKSRCKERTKDNKSNKRTYTQEEVEQKIKEAEQKIKEVEEKYEVIADQRAQKMVLCLVDKLMPNQTTNSHNNSHNNITQNNNIQNNNNTNLKINNFGKEKTKYITDANLKIMFVDPRNVIVQHIKDTYYHVFHPENFNAKITNCKSKHMHILKENEWEKVNKQLTICSMYNKHEKIIESEFERLKPELTDTVKDNYKEYKQSTLHSFNIFKHRMVDIEAVIINGTKRHKQIDLLSEKEVARLSKEQGKTPGEIFAEHMPDIFGEDDED
jgi:hypothetical protein